MKQKHTDTAHFFISYSRSDRLAVDQLVNDLRRRSYKIWIDVAIDGIEMGDNWRHELKTQLASSQGVIICLSPDLLASPYCQAEIKQALDEGKPLFPVVVRRLDDDAATKLNEFGLADYQYIDLTQSYKTGLERVLYALPPPQLRTQQMIRRVGLIFGVLILLLGVFVGIALATRAGSSLFPTATPIPPSPTPTPLPGSVIIAIAHFHNAPDNEVTDEEAHNLVSQMEEWIRAELDGGTIVGNIPLLLIPAEQVGCIGGANDNPDGDPFTCDGAADEDERQRAAETVADAYGADIVLYGEIIADNGEVSVNPEFYVEPDTFIEALEVTGPYRFGKIVETSDDSSAASNAGLFGPTLQQRTAVVARIFAGLVHFSQRNFNEALDIFEETNALQTTEDSLEGQEVLQVLIGNTYGQLAAQAGQRGQLEVANDYLDNAEEAFMAAEVAAGGDLEGRPQYSRVYAGLAAITYLRWNFLAQAEAGNIFAPIDTQRDLLNDALGYLERADDADEQPSDIGIDNRSRFVRIQILYALYAELERVDIETLDNLIVDDRGCSFRVLDFGERLIADDNPLVTDLVCNAESLLFDFGDSEVALKPLAAETYFYLGRLALMQNPDICPPLMEEALDLNPPKVRQMFMHGTLGRCHMERGDNEAAVTEFNTAIDLAYEVDAHPDDLARFEADRDEAQAFQNGRG